jgi:gamma-glutamyltranspeptidase / glutathione hydrolase
MRNSHYLTRPSKSPRWHKFRSTSLVGLAVLLTLSPVAAQRQQVEPEQSTERNPDTRLVVASKQMVSSANPLASNAGLDMLRRGGSAIDAAIATQLVLGLVEPQSSGLGGGAFILNWDQTAKVLKTYDGRETAPATATPDRFIKNGAPVAFQTAVNSGLSIGTPGLVRLLAVSHAKHGRLPWAQLFEPAIALAENGFEVSKRLHFLLMWNGTKVFDATATKLYFDDSGNARPRGAILKNPEYAATLRAIASGGADAFYSGPIAESIVKAVASAPNFAGDLTAADLAAYTVKERAALCVPYRRFKICGMGPPSSGGVAVAQIFTMLDHLSIGTGPAASMNAQALHFISEAEKLAYADRDRYLADPDFVSVPAGLSDPTYLASRRALIKTDDAMDSATPGEPPGFEKQAFGEDATQERAGTSHLSVIDGAGNAVSMTTTIEGVFGSGVMAGGFLLNNELTDFSFQSTDKNGKLIANRVEPGKRPRSSMAPTIVFDNAGEVVAVLGSPGGGRIILYVTKTLVGLLDWNLDAQAATGLMNFGTMGKAIEFEYGLSALWTALKLKSYGHSVSFDLMNSGTHVIVRRGDGTLGGTENVRLEGGADPRREGMAVGD